VTTMRGMPALRGLRGSVVGLSAAGLGVLGHTMAGGALPSVSVVALVTAGLVLLGVAMSDRLWGLPSLLSVLLGAQLVLHVVLASSARAEMPAMPGMSHQGTVPGLAMTAVHVGAAVVAAALLRRGELWCQSLLHVLGRPVRAVLLAALPVPRPPRPTAHPAPATGHHLQLSHSLSRRGPPAPSLA
jgi:hypothetical protein